MRVIISRDKDVGETEALLTNSGEENRKLLCTTHTLSLVHPVPELCRGGLKDTKLTVYCRRMRKTMDTAK